MHFSIRGLRSCKYLIAACIFSLTPLAVQATQVTVKGQVEFVRTHDANILPGWAPPVFWFTLKGVTSAGSCQKFASGTVLFIARDKTELALILSAYSGAQEIEVVVDDVNLVNGFCLSSYITIGNPAPLY